jgi:hypothetical protein
VRERLVTTAFRVKELLPAPVKRLLKGTSVGRSVQGVMRSNSVDALPAYDGEAVRAAVIRAMAAGPRLTLDVVTLAKLGDDLGGALKGTLLDASAVDDGRFVNAVNMLHARGVRDVAMLPSDALVAAGKQAWGPFVHAGDATTRVLVHNYFGKNYVVDDTLVLVVLVATPSGATFATARLLAPDETVVLSGAELAGAERVDFASGASVVCLALHPGLARIKTREFRYVIAVETAGGCGVVHSLPATRFSVAQEVGNGTKGYVTPATRDLLLVKSAGDPPAELCVGADGVQPGRAVGRVDTLPASGAEGWAALNFAFAQPMRTAQGFYVGRDSTGGVFVHHDQGAHARPPVRLSPSAAFATDRYLTSLCIPLFNDKGVDLGIVVDERNALNTYQTLAVAIRDDAGRVKADTRVAVTGPLTVVDATALRARAGLAPGQCGYVHIVGVTDGAEVHDLVDSMIAFGFYRHGARLLDTVEAGTSPYADFAPIVNDGFTDRRRLAFRAKKFAPFVSDPRWRARLWTVNVGFTRASGPADLTLSLRRPGETEVRHHQLAPGEARLFDLDEEFGLGQRPGHDTHDTVWLESRHANLFGIYVYEDRRDPLRFGLDHLTGG